ncbi:hypothetical protein GQR58_002112 [Nymphon striatum]|nr:hypothetical protein GQR58_002112 [Nymphon striatum]
MEGFSARGAPSRQRFAYSCLSARSLPFGGSYVAHSPRHPSMGTDAPKGFANAGAVYRQTRRRHAAFDADCVPHGRRAGAPSGFHDADWRIGPAVSISMHYNRLAWAAAFVAIVAALIPPTRPNTGVVDGVIIGAMACVLHCVGKANDVTNGWGWNIRGAIGITAAMALALTAPSFFNLAYSPFRHVALDTAKYAPILPRGGVHTDLQSIDVRINRIDARVALDGQVTGLPAYDGRDDPAMFMGEEISNCSIELGLPRIMDTIARDLEDAGLSEGKSLFAADLFSSHWLFGDLEPMESGAPWYYGGVPGLRHADYFLVPLCPVAQPAQVQIFEIVEELVEIGKINARAYGGFKVLRMRVDGFTKQTATDGQIVLLDRRQCQRVKQLRTFRSGSSG